MSAKVPRAQRSAQPRALGLATLLAGVLCAPLPSAAAAASHGARLLAAPGAAANGWLAQRPPTPALGSGELQELIRQAYAFAAKGAYAEAGRLWEQILASTEKVLGPEHPDTATSINNLALLYKSQGRYGEAEPLYKRSLVIIEKALGPEHPDTATSLNNLAALHQSQGRYGEAEPLYKRSLAIIEKALGPEHPSTANSLNNLAELYRNQGRYGEAEPLYKRSLVIIEKALGPEHPDTATSLNNLAALYDNQGRYGEAEPLYKRSLAISEKALGPEHPDTATSLNNLTLLYFEMAKAPAAEPLLQRLNQHQASWLRRELPLQPREQRRALIDQQPDASAITFALLAQSPTAAPLALETRLNRQGLLAEIERRQALLKGSSPETRRLAEQLAGIDRQLASITLPPAQRQPLRQQRQQLEGQLFRLLPALKIDPVTNAQVAAALKAAAPRGLLLEFQKFSPWGKGAKGQAGWGPPRYVALLLKPDGTIRAVGLGEAAPIEAAVAAALAASADRNQQAAAAEKLAAVSRLVLTPLQRELDGVRELFVSPDGDLHRLPFAALPMPAADGNTPAAGPSLGEALSLRLLTTGRELLRLQQPAKAGGPAVLIANPDFNATIRPASSSTTAAAGAATLARGSDGAESPGRQQRAGGLESFAPWQSLPGTEKEARALAPLLGSKNVISGAAATSRLVLAQQAPRLLHIATHGFFLADQPTAPGAATRASPGAPFTLARADNPEDPLQRSGLVFAGANRPEADPDDDGYLTAAEATAMELEGTDLVILSACETGLGGVRRGEGVYGLQRSLAVAGARSTLLSLWKVDDDLTATFMQSFYQRLKAGEGRADALRNTQAEFRNHKNSTYNDIRVWGAFQLSGDWRPLTGW